MGLGAGFEEAVKTGDKNATDLTLKLLNEADIVEGGGTITGLTRDNVNGGYLIDVTNPDGSPGVKTQNGTKDPDDPAIFIPDAKLLDTANTVWDSTVMPHQNIIGVAANRATQNVINTNVTANGEEVTARRELSQRVGEVINAIPPGAPRTHAIGGVASADNDAEKLEIVNEMGKDLGLEPLTPPKQTGVDLTDAQNEQVARRQAQAQTSGDGKMLKGTEALYNAVEQVESGGDHSAVSPAGAQGVMQLMPATAKNPGYGIEGVKDDSEAENRRVGREYLDAMLKKYDGNLEYALAAYNQGPKATDDWIAAGADPDKMPGGKETREYADKVFAQMGGKPQSGPVSRESRLEKEYPEPDRGDDETLIDYSYAEISKRVGGSREATRKAATLQASIQKDLEIANKPGPKGPAQDAAEARLKANQEKLRAVYTGADQLRAEAQERKDEPLRKKLKAIDAQLGRNITDSRRKSLEARREKLIKDEGLLPESNGTELVREKPEDANQPATKITSSNNVVQQQFDDFAKVSEGKTNDELADMIISGEVNLSPQARQQVAEKLQAEGIQKIEDLRRLNNKDRALALAALASTVNSGTAGSNAGMGTEAAALRQQVLGLVSPYGQAIGPKDFATIQQRRESSNNTLSLQLKRFEAEQDKAAIGFADELVNGVAEIMGDEELGDLGERSDRVLQSGILNTFWNKLSLFNAKDHPEQHKMLMKSANMVFSQVAAGEASKEKGGAWESVVSLFRKDSDENLGASDQFLSRVIIDGNRIQYITQPTLVNGQWQYDVLDESFSIRELNNKNSQAGNFLKKAAQANSERYGRPQ
jgi:hypothetical protein